MSAVVVVVRREKDDEVVLSRLYLDVAPEEAVGALLGYLKAEQFEGEFHVTCVHTNPTNPTPEVSP